MKASKLPFVKVTVESYALKNSLLGIRLQRFVSQNNSDALQSMGEKIF